MRIELAPGFDALYYSFYLEGLRRFFPASRWRWSTRGFPTVGHHGLAMRWGGRRLFLSASDGPGLNPVAMQWAEIFGKVNLDPATCESTTGATVIPLGPSFPVRVWRPAEAWPRALVAWVLGRANAHSAREHFAAYRRQYRYRLPESSYQPGRSQEHYVFFLSRLWRKETDTNRLRADFVNAVRAHPLAELEGGFPPRWDEELAPYRPLFSQGTVSIGEWVDKTRRSALVFNTPAVSGCHGWKLAEYLALGKAILSTPLSRAMPAPFLHGTHAHIVESTAEAIAEGVDLLLEDSSYRLNLERNARTYYETYLSPQSVMQRLSSALGGLEITSR